MALGDSTCTGRPHRHKIFADRSINQIIDQPINQGLIITGQQNLRILFRLTKMQHGFLPEGGHDCDENDVEVDLHVDNVVDPRCNDSRRMSMVCVMPEWSSKDLWIEAAPPSPPQETSLAWEKKVEKYIFFYSWLVFVKQVDGDFVNLTATARGPSLIRTKMTAPQDAFFMSPPGPQWSWFRYDQI